MSRQHPHLFEISTVPWLYQLSRSNGRKVTLGDVPTAEWDRLQQFGFDFVWLMGVWRKSPMGRHIFQDSSELYPVYNEALPGWTPEDVVGSPYSIQYYKPDPEAGSWDDLDSARAELAKRGIKLILDFVPNHTGPDHPWVTERPERYIQGGAEDFQANPKAFFPVGSGDQTIYIAKGRDPYFDPWKDTVQLNYFHPSARQAMIDTLKEIHQHCDGVRCDMAMLVLNDIFSKTWGALLREPAPEQEFWTEARPQLPDMLWIAEAYWGTEGRLQQLGFDYVYDKTLYDRSLHSTPHEIQLHLGADPEYQRGLVRFIENHDEPRSAHVFPPGRLEAAATLYSTLPGLRLYNQGQFEGYKTHLPVQLVRAKDEPPDEDLMRFYENLLSVANHACFHEGHWQLLHVEPAFDDTNQNLICHRWRLGDELRVVISNFADHYSQGRIMLGGEVNPDRPCRFVDLLAGKSYQRNGSEVAERGLHVVLSNYQSHVFSVDQ